MKTGLFLILFLFAIPSLVCSQGKKVLPKSNFTSIHDESEAVFPGDSYALSNFIFNNIKLPAGFTKNGHSGLVHVQFTIDSSGKVINPKIVKSLGFGCDEEALRVSGLMPNWIPAKRLGSSYSSSRILKIPFEIDEPNEQVGGITLLRSKKDIATLNKIHRFVTHRLNSIYLKDSEIETEHLSDNEYQLGFILNRYGVLHLAKTSDNTPYSVAHRVETLFSDEKQFEIKTLGFDSILLFVYAYKVADNGLYIKNKMSLEVTEMSSSLITLFSFKLPQRKKDTILTASEELVRIAKLIDSKEFEKAHEVINQAIQTSGENINYTFLKAIAFLKEGDKQKSCALFQLALKTGYAKGFSQTATKEKIEEYLLDACSSE